MGERTKLHEQIDRYIGQAAYCAGTASTMQKGEFVGTMRVGDNLRQLIDALRSAGHVIGDPEPRYGGEAIGNMFAYQELEDLLERRGRNFRLRCRGGSRFEFQHVIHT